MASFCSASFVSSSNASVSSTSMRLNVLPVGEGERVVCQLDEVRFAAHGLQLTHGLQVVGQ